MKLTPEEIDVFKSLSNSEVGAFLVAYVKKVQDYCYDCRNWDKDTTPESAKLAAKVLQETIIDKVRSVNVTKNSLSEHE